MSDDGKPTFGELRDALMPPGTDKDALWSALKNAQVTGGHFPGKTAPDISGPVPPAVRELTDSGYPADPFSAGHIAGIGLAEMYNDMLAGGIPLSSVERILVAMLAAYGIMEQDGS